MAWQTAEGMIAAEAPVSARVAFIRKTYLRLQAASERASRASRVQRRMRLTR